MDSYWTGGYNSYQNNGLEKNDFNKIASSIGTNIQKISQNVLSLKKMINLLGTSQDSPELRKKFLEIQHYTSTLSSDTSAQMKQLDAIALPQSLTEQREWKMQKERLTSEFTSTLNAFQDTQRLACSKEKEEAKRKRANVSLPPPPSSDPFDNTLLELQETSQTKQSLVQLQLEEQNLQQIEAQEQAILQLESDINDVNMIFKDLGAMVHNQGEVIDSIEAYVENAEAAVGLGHNSLKQAGKSANQARKKMFIIYLIIGIIILCLALLIFWH